MIEADTVIKGYASTREVTLDGAPLDPNPSQLVYNHSPDGFCWGYGGSGPAQLALAIMLQLVPDEAVAVGMHQAFKRDFLEPMNMGDDFELKGAELIRWLEKKPIAKAFAKVLH
jgi:hypothetical protein